MDHYQDRLAGFRKSDQDRDALLQEVVEALSALQVRLDDVTSDYDNEKESRKRWQEKYKETEQSLKQHLQASESNNFILMLIDGDGAIFQESFYENGEQGGAEAAHLLRAAIKNECQQRYPDVNMSDWQIVVQVFLNQQGLAGALHKTRYITHDEQLVMFGQAFGFAQPLFSFIDVGSGKERADHKIRETLRLFVSNSQCKHIFFAPCHDNGYLPVLETLRGSKDVAERLTLVATRPPEPGFLKLGLRITHFPSVFRAEDLPTYTPGLTHRSASMSLPPVFPQSQQYTGQADKENNPPSPVQTPIKPGGGSYAAIGKNGGAQVIDITPSLAKPGGVQRFLFLNGYRERLDRDLPRTQQTAEARFAQRCKDNQRNFCNSYHLLGACPDSDACGYTHGPMLNPAERLVLQHKARSLPCSLKMDCVDFDCYMGHHCKYRTSKCLQPNCQYRDTHGKDFELAKKYYEDESEEWLQTYLDKHK